MMLSSVFVVEEAAPGVTREYSADGHIVIFGVHDGSTQTIARWADQVKATLLRWPADQPCFLLHDLHRSSFHAFDSFMRTKFDELFVLRPQMERWVAVILPEGDGARFARINTRVRELLVASSYPVHWEIFTSRKQATNWLMRHSVV